MRSRTLEIRGNMEICWYLETQGFFQGGTGHLPPFGFGLPPLGYTENSISLVNQFKPL